MLLTEIICKISSGLVSVFLYNKTKKTPLTEYQIKQIMRPKIKLTKKRCFILVKKISLSFAKKSSARLFSKTPVITVVTKAEISNEGFIAIENFAVSPISRFDVLLYKIQ